MLTWNLKKVFLLTYYQDEKNDVNNFLLFNHYL